MVEYHVGCGLCGIYAGTLCKDKTRWNNKSDVTEEAIDAVAEYLMMKKKDVTFDYQGKRYRMGVREEDNE